MNSNSSCEARPQLLLGLLWFVDGVHALVHHTFCLTHKHAGYGGSFYFRSTITVGKQISQITNLNSEVSF